jgi:hypothetical protein
VTYPRPAAVHDRGQESGAEAAPEVGLAVNLMLLLALGQGLVTPQGRPGARRRVGDYLLGLTEDR